MLTADLQEKFVIEDKEKMHIGIALLKKKNI